MVRGGVRETLEQGVAYASAVPTVSHRILVEASLAETWDQYFDPRGWGAWVDGFQAVVEASADYPEAGGTLRWRSIPAGRGEVLERVTAHERRRRHVIEFEDPAMGGELETAFAIEGSGTRVGQNLVYRVLDRGPLARIGSLLFVKAQVRASMQRTLMAFKHEAEEAARFSA